MNNTNYPAWLKDEALPRLGVNQHSSIWSRWSEYFLLKRSLGGGPCVIHASYHCAKINDNDRLFKIMADDMGLRLVFKSLANKTSAHRGNEYYFVCENGDVGIQAYEEVVDIEINCTDENTVCKFIDILKQETQIVNRTKFVHVMVNTEEGPDLVSAGSAHTPLVRDNYEQGVVDNFDFIVEQMNAKNPFGRLIIMNGAPGTGKTYLVRGLIDAIENAMFILVPSHMLVEMTGPSLIQAVLNARGNIEEESPGPIVLICEDADELLVPRMGDNLPQISSLLNFGDGILGNLLDIRVIATTNARKIEIDKALLRPGRLCRHVDVVTLSAERSARIYKRLTGKEAAFSDGTILAEIYQKATVKDKNGVAHQNFKDSVIGFKS